MDEFHFIKDISTSIELILDVLTQNKNIFIKEVHVESGKTVIKYEILTEYGIKTKEKFFFNNIEK